MLDAKKYHRILNVLIGYFSIRLSGLSKCVLHFASQRNENTRDTDKKLRKWAIALLLASPTTEIREELPKRPPLVPFTTGRAYTRRLHHG